MSMLSSNGEGESYIKYVSRDKWEVYTGGSRRVLFSNSGVDVTGNQTVSGDLTVSGKTVNPDLSGAITTTGSLEVTDDVNAAGGFAQSFTFVSEHMLQETFTDMTSAYVTGGIGGEVSFTSVAMPRAGSVRGFTILARDNETIKSGAFSASISVDGVTGASSVLAANTGSVVGSTFAKDTSGLTFSANSVIRVHLTASADYLCEPDITSASFIATVMVEM